MKTRFWPEETHEKRAEGCRICGASEVELAHVTGRSHDRPRQLPTRPTKAVYVEPESVIPLCPDHHRAYDAHEIDILQYLRAPEQIRAVEDLGSIESARRRLCPSEFLPSPQREAVTAASDRNSE
jgi:hypothetical protein